MGKSIIREFRSPVGLRFLHNMNDSRSVYACPQQTHSDLSQIANSLSGLSGEVLISRWSDQSGPITNEMIASLKTACNIPGKCRPGGTFSPFHMHFHTTKQLYSGAPPNAEISLFLQNGKWGYIESSPWG